MKRLLLILVLVCQTALADCEIRSAAQMTGQYDIGPVQNLYKETTILGQCYVKYDIVVDGTKHTVDNLHRGFEQQETLCNLAIQQARTNLLAGLGGKFKSESVTVCQDGNGTEPTHKIGDLILESEVGKVQNSKYYTWHGTTCRRFVERQSIKGKLSVTNGVICQTDNHGTNWLIVDKW